MYTYINDTALARLMFTLFYSFPANVRPTTSPSAPPLCIPCFSFIYAPPCTPPSFAQVRVQRCRCRGSRNFWRETLTAKSIFSYRVASSCAIVPEPDVTRACGSFTRLRCRAKVVKGPPRSRTARPPPREHVSLRQMKVRIIDDGGGNFPIALNSNFLYHVEA